ncbi:MAG: VCBS domain-containing protein [Pluralibacter gergoviae]|nr:VCBS domain-containing protein [Pluralibacter gergoviae]
MLTVTESTATEQSNHTGSGSVFIGLLGGLLNIGSGTAMAQFSVGNGHSADIVANITGGSLLSAINDLDVAVQRWDNTAQSWVTVKDSVSSPSLITIIGGQTVSLNAADLGEGQYRVVAFSDNPLLGVLSSTNVDVQVTDSGPVISGTAVGNAITDDDGVNGSDSVPPGTVVSQIINSDGTIVTVPASGESVTIQGEYGVLTIKADGSYSYEITNVSSANAGKTDVFTYVLSNGMTTSNAQLEVMLGQGSDGGTGDTLQAQDNDVVMIETPLVTTEIHSDSGFLLVGALSNLLTLLGNQNAAVNFVVSEGHSADIEVNVQGTSLLNALNSVNVLIQRFNSTTGQWETVADSHANSGLIVIIDNNRVTLRLDDLGVGQYRAIGYSDNTLLGLASNTTVSVIVTDTGPDQLHGSLNGNVITDSDAVHGIDAITVGTVVSSVTDAQGLSHAVAAGGTTILGQYGTLTIYSDGKYVYTLTTSAAQAEGKSENFTYTLSDGTHSSSANLNITLGTQGEAAPVIAVDDTATLQVDALPETVDHGASSKTGFALLKAGLGDVLDLSLLNFNDQIRLSVGADEVRNVSMHATAGGIMLGATFDLYIYKYNETSGNYELFKQQKDWFLAVLGGKSSNLDYTLGQGDYLLLMNISNGVTVAGGYTLVLDKDVSYLVTTESGSVSGNVIAGDSAGGEMDTLPSGSVLSSVNGIAVSSTGSTVIQGEFGTLTINANGAYTYALNAGQSLSTVGQSETFTYTVKAPDGTLASATLTVNLQHPVLDAVDDSVSRDVAFTNILTTNNQDGVTTATLANSKSQDVTKDFQGNFHVTDGHQLQNITLQYVLSDDNILANIGLQLSYYITNSAGQTVASSSSVLSTSSGLTTGSTVNVALTGVNLAEGDYTLHIHALSPKAAFLDVTGNATISANIHGTEVALGDYHTTEQTVTATGNLFDGSGSDNHVDNVISVGTTLTVQGSGASITVAQNDSAPHTVQGSYGTLTVYGDGSYSYTMTETNLNNLTHKEVFNYTLNGPSDQSASATLTIDLHPQLTGSAYADTIGSTAYNDTFTSGAGADSVIFHLLDNADATGGNGHDTWQDFSASDGDRIDVSELLTDWDGNNDDLGQYLSVEHTESGDTVVSIDRDGSAGAAFQPTELITLENTNMTLEELIQHHTTSGHS